jgi:sulfite reductase (NADPH) hemoprotein beta-component
MDSQVNPNEIIKANSRYLRGTLKESIADPVTGAVSPDDAQISKFHGFYQQDDRDQRLQRQEQFLEPYYSFMLRARLPGGICTPQQWLTIDAVARELGNGTIRLTTRQTFQYHGILKKNLKPLIQGINRAMIDSISGCGDVNRNVLCNPNPEHSALHAEVYQWARRISEHLLPKTRAYHEIWLDGEPEANRSRSMARPICPANSRRRWRYRPRTMWMSTPTTWASWRSPTASDSKASTCWPAVEWAQPTMTPAPFRD